MQCAWAASRKKASYPQAQYHRLRGRRGPKKAVRAVAASILTAAYHMLKDGTAYRDLGPDHFDRRAKGSRLGGSSAASPTSATLSSSRRSGPDRRAGFLAVSSALTTHRQSHLKQLKHRPLTCAAPCWLQHLQQLSHRSLAAAVQLG